MPTAAKLRTYAADPMAFFADAFTARGLMMADFQRSRFAIVAPSVQALARGETPPIGRIWLEGVKGSSKDSDLALCLLWLASFSSVPVDAQIGAGDADQSDELRKAAKEWLQFLPWLNGRVRLLNGRLVSDATKAEMAFVASDASGGAHGSRCLLYVVNEISHISKTEFWLTLLDNADKVPHGLVVVATNAGFVGTDAWRLREQYRTADHCAFHQFCGPVPWANEKHRLDARKRNTLARYLRLYEGVWSSGGDALELSDIEASVDKSMMPMLGRQSGFGFVGGLDLGIRHDHSAFCIIGKRQVAGQPPAYRLARLWTWAPSPVTGKVDLESVKATVIGAKQAYGLQSLCFDPWQAMLLAEQITREAGLRCVEIPFTGKNLDLLARNLLEVYRNRAFTMPDDSRLLADLAKLTIVEKSYGYRLEATRDADGHADAATALVLGLLAARDHCRDTGEAWGGSVASLTSGPSWQYRTRTAPPRRPWQGEPR